MQRVRALSGRGLTPSRAAGGGFCPFADITLAVAHLRMQLPTCRRVLIVDLDGLSCDFSVSHWQARAAHQGNGHARDKLRTKDGDLFVLDIFNGEIYPGDERAKDGIDVRRELRCGASSEVPCSLAVYRGICKLTLWLDVPCDTTGCTIGGG